MQPIIGSLCLPLTLIFAVQLSCSCFAQSTRSNKAKHKNDLQEYLVGQLDVLKFDELEPAARISIYLSISKALNTGGRQELSKAVEADAVELAERDKEGSHDRAVFDHALETKQFEMANEIAKRPKSKFMKKRLIAARIRDGQLEAFKEEDYKITDFHTADRIARALVDAGEHAKAIDFATGLVFEANDGNAPETIPGFVYSQIAHKEFKAGKIEEAKKHVDQAKKIAGGLYYTGFCIEVDHRTIHGKLTDNVKKFASRGAAYRSHMGDELVANFARALRENGCYKEARQAIQHIVDLENLDHAKAYIAIEQIKKQEFDLAKESIKLVEMPGMQFLAKVQLAVQLKKASRQSESEALVNELEKAWIEGNLAKCDDRFWYLLGATNDFSRAKRHLERLNTEREKSKMILAVLKGLAATPIY